MAAAIVLEDLATVKVAAFGKTGTLTHGRPELTEIVLAHGVDETTALAVAAGVERASEHPLARRSSTAPADAASHHQRSPT